ncbi:cobalt-precorrin-5B (C(1))-methyltransferase CbiD [Agathobaculum sp.]|uniref:cobalt-precorrin-5B (C(1))-methyltransferase CbiD n=1 Tax=Agathobaculum sp. TaxID=2048138 RepID=UPI0027B89B5F|nr:cobalt-precorrin-5B (C(1))-methyltransferase CbiD [Agathobaculum sp.]
MQNQHIAYHGGQALRRGWTTGTCAAAAAEAAALLLLTGRAPAELRLETPGGLTFTLPVEQPHLDGDAAVCTVRKDAGDDPDITNGVGISATVCRAEPGVAIDGGAGVGRVTRPGLAMPVGAAAINPGPRAQITAALGRAARACGYTGGFSVIISAENGEELARQTYNEHLGVVGGLSILGTSGIVEPMSEKALVDTILLELDSLYAGGQRTAFLCPGNYGADFARDTLGLDLEKAAKCSNFIGEALDHAVFRGFDDILLVGHAGKLVKLAAGVMNTHSSVADGRQEIFTAHAALCGAGRDTLEGLMQSISVDACIELLDRENLREPVLARIESEIEKRLALRLRGRGHVEFILFTAKYGILAQSPGAMALCERLRESK